MNETQQINNNRMVLLLIAGIPVIMILAATWLWYFVVQGNLDLVGTLGTANRGALVQPPRQIDDKPLAAEGGTLFRYADFEPRWTLLVPNAGKACAADCEHSLYITRQIHIAMGKEFNRIRRVYLGDTPLESTALEVTQLSDERPPPGGLAELLDTEHRGLKALTLPAEDYPALFPEQAGDATTWYLVDPAGWIMMTYNSDVPYKDVISDLKFLLKNSSG